MALFDSAFDTTAMGGERTDRFERLCRDLQGAQSAYDLKSFKIKNPMRAQETSVYLLCGGNARMDQIPAFNHPILMRQNGGVFSVYIDARNYSRWNAAQARIHVSNMDELVWNIRRGMVECIWRGEPKKTLQDISPIPMQAYASLISEVIARRFSLNPAEQIRAQVAAAYGYLSFFSDNESADISQVAAKIARAIGHVDASTVETILDSCTPINHVDDLCVCIAKAVDSIRLHEFNRGLFYTLVCGNWFGGNARENMAVAMEHIPTWLMICWASVSEATFRRSSVAKLIERFSRSGHGDAFDKSMRQLTQSDNVANLILNV